MQKKVITIVHTSLVSYKYLNDLFSSIIPEAKVYNIVDESLLEEVSKSGKITPEIVNRMCKYFDAAATIGSSLIFNQCSSVGEAAEIAAKTVNVPVLRVDEAMAEKAVELGGRIGVVATVSSTIDPSCNLIKRKAILAKKKVKVIPYLVDGALDILMNEGQEKHNKYVKKVVEKCSEECDVVVLAQGSMVVLLPELSAINKPVLTSPELGVQKAKKFLLN